MNFRRIKLLGLGDAGSKMASRIKKMYDADVEQRKDELSETLKASVTAVAVNTNRDSLIQPLLRGSHIKKLLIGQAVTNGQGSGDRPERALKAFEADKERVFAHIRDCDVCIPIASLGKSTGFATIVPVIKYAQESKKLVLPVVARPVITTEIFPSKLAEAQKKLKEIDELSVRFFQINNEVAYTQEDVSVEKAYDLFDEPIAQGLVGLIRFLAQPYDVDINDLITWVLCGRGRIWLGRTTVNMAKITNQETATEAFDRAYKECANSYFYETDSRLCDSEKSADEIAAEIKRNPPFPCAVMFFVEGENLLSASRKGLLTRTFNSNLPQNSERLRSYYSVLPTRDPESKLLQITALWSEETREPVRKIPDIHFPVLHDVEDDEWDTGQASTASVGHTASEHVTHASVDRQYTPAEPAITSPANGTPAPPTTVVPAAVSEPEPEIATTVAISKDISADTAPTREPEPLPPGAFKSFSSLVRAAAGAGFTKNPNASEILNKDPDDLPSHLASLVRFTEIPSSEIVQNLNWLKNVGLHNGWREKLRTALKSDGVKFRTSVNTKTGQYHLKPEDDLAGIKKNRDWWPNISEEERQDLVHTFLAVSILGRQVLP